MHKKYKISKKVSARGKNNNLKNVAFCLIGVLAGVLSAVLLLLIIALIIKEGHLDEGVISIFTTVAKIIASFICVRFTISKVDMHPIFTGVVSSGLYMLISSLLFVALSQNKYFDFRIFGIDILIGIASGALFSLILGKKSLYLKNK